MGTRVRFTLKNRLAAVSFGFLGRGGLITLLFLFAAFLDSVLLLGGSCDGSLTPLLCGFGKTSLGGSDLRIVSLDLVESALVNVSKGLRYVGVLVGGDTLVPSFVDPAVFAGLFVRLAVDTTSQVDGLVSLGRLAFLFIAIFLGSGVLIEALGQLNLLDLGVIERLGGLLVLETEPGLIVSVLGQVTLLAHVVGPHKQNHLDAGVLELIKLHFDLAVVVHANLIVSEVVSGHHGREVGIALVVFATKVGKDLAFAVDYEGLGVKLLGFKLEEGVVGNSKGDVLDALQLQIVVLIIFEGHWVVVTILKSLINKLLNVSIEFLVLLTLGLLQIICQEKVELLREGRNLVLLARVEHEVHYAAVSRLNHASSFSQRGGRLHSVLDRLLHNAELGKLLSHGLVNEVLGNGLLVGVGQGLFSKELLE